jgi:hypothetical protein
VKQKFIAVALRGVAVALRGVDEKVELRGVCMM